jgi:7-keto-8-aminopelargonate synthetase-like enzyme
MKPMDFYAARAIDRTLVETLAFNPYYQPLSGLGQGRPLIDGGAHFDLASNDYLGLASDERLKAAMVDAVREYGSSQCGTPIATGYARILAELEQTLARFVGLDDALIFPSCYQANASLFTTVATPRDVIIIDQYAHASLAVGVKAVGCKIRPFRHNDPAHLERQLAAATAFPQVFVVTESVFSTEGSVAPLDTIIDLCERYDAIPVVDDSHGLGVLGSRGRGILEEKGVADFKGIYTASLGKALANLGGMIAGKKNFIDFFRYSCPGLIYSTALPPVCAAGVTEAIRIITGEFDRLGAAMWANHRRLVETLGRCGFTLNTGAAPIASLACGSALNTLALAKQFQEQRLLATPFIPPSVPPDQGVLRLIVGAKLDSHGMQGVIEALNHISARCPP